MSVVVAVTSESNGCLATDSQETNLETLGSSFTRPKSLRVTEHLVVGYVGHSDPCEAIATLAKKIHSAKQGNSNIDCFLESIRSAIDLTKLQYGQNCLNSYYTTFIIVGMNDDNNPTILVYGTASNFRPYSAQRDKNGISKVVLPPEDVDMDIANSIAKAEMTKDTASHLDQYAIRVVSKISQLSQYCGGEPRTLWV